MKKTLQLFALMLVGVFYTQNSHAIYFINDHGTCMVCYGIGGNTVRCVKAHNGPCTWGALNGNFDRVVAVNPNFDPKRILDVVNTEEMTILKSPEGHSEIKNTKILEELQHR